MAEQVELGAHAGEDLPDIVVQRLGQAGALALLGVQQGGGQRLVVGAGLLQGLGHGVDLPGQAPRLGLRVIIFDHRACATITRCCNHSRHLQDDLADMIAALHAGMGLSRVSQRVNLVDDRQAAPGAEGRPNVFLQLTGDGGFLRSGTRA